MPQRARPEPELRAEPIEPHIEESAGKHSQMATFQDLLRTDADADIFEQLATTVPMRVDPVSGEATTLGPAGLTTTWATRPMGSTCWSTGCGGRSPSGCRTATSPGL